MVPFDFSRLQLMVGIVSPTRSKWFAVFAVLFLTTVGALASNHCHCDEASVACEHAGEVCTTPDDCSDCLLPSSAVAAVPVALLPNPVAKAPLGLMPPACLVLYFRLGHPSPSAKNFRPSPIRLVASVALRPGALSLRV